MSTWGGERYGGPLDEEDEPSGYCPKCGAPLARGQEYCGRCGTRSKKPGLPGSGRSRLAAIAGTILSAPLVLVGGLLGVLVSFGVPVLFVSALVQGPDDTWAMLRQWIPGVGDEGDPACAGYDVWWDETRERDDQASRLFDELAPIDELGSALATAEPAELRRLSVTIDRIATE